LRSSTVLKFRKNSAPEPPDEQSSCRFNGMQLKPVSSGKRRWMRRTRTLFTLRLSLILGLIAFHSSQMRANVAITSPTGGNNLSADKALNSTNGAAFTALGNIVITEGAATDFAAGNNQTLILTPPTGWQFNPGVGTVTFTSSRDIMAATISVTASNL